MRARPLLIILAAGRGSRFAAEGHKLEQPLQGLTLFARTLVSAIASHLPVLVVTTGVLEAQARQFVAARDVVVLPEAGSASELGMGYSIAAGVGARPDAPGWLLLPADMPLVQPSTMAAVARALEHHPVAYAQHRGRRGHPVGFASELYSELVTLTGDQGARRLVARYPAHAVDVEDPGVLVDVDTEEDLIALRAAHAQASAAAHPK
jgi:molybdenum cofactor cytidylyltransferase